MKHKNFVDVVKVHCKLKQKLSKFNYYINNSLCDKFVGTISNNLKKSNHDETAEILKKGSVS